jgi:hypothetical protein
MARIRAVTFAGLLVAQAVVAFNSGCVVRTYDDPYYYQRQPRRVYGQPQAHAQPGAYGGARYAQPAPQYAPAPAAYGGARYGQPAQYAPAPAAYGGASYGRPPQPQYSPGAMGGARYGGPAPYAGVPVGTTIYGPPAAGPPAPPAYGPPAPAQPLPGQPGAIWVPADRPEPVWLNWALAPGQWYVLEAWGVFSCWGDRNDGVDPYYAYGEWRVGAQPQPWGQLMVDDRPMYELAKASSSYHAYRPDHFYQAMIQGNGNRLRFQIADAKNGSWSDNHGGLWVRVYPMPRR